MVDPKRCDDLADMLAEVATGAASGPDRALVLSHLGECDDCRRELDELTRVADEVLLVAPVHEPPAGFGSAVLARIAELAGDEDAEAAKPAATEPSVTEPSPIEPPSAEPSSVVPIRKRRPLRHLMQAAAAAAIGLAGAATVWVATEDERDVAATYRDALDTANGRYFATVPVRDDSGGQVGYVALYEGEPSWLYAILREAPGPGPYDVVVTTEDGSDVIATCEVTDGACAVGAVVDTHIYQITAIELVPSVGSGLTTDLSRRSSD